MKELSLLFNLRASHGTIASAFLDTITVPVSKNKNRDVKDPGNYRSIAMSKVITKLFEHLILSHALHICIVVKTNLVLSLISNIALI